LKRIGLLAFLMIFVISAVGCGSLRKRDKGALIGAGAGAVVGGVIGHKAGNTAVGAILGAAVGGAAGAYIGNYMDKQAAEIERDLEGAHVERVGEGIKITFASGILFDVNKSDLRSTARTDLERLAAILNRYPDTDVLIEGHTDSTGPSDYNLTLSMRRAQSVANTIVSDQVRADRLHIMGYGEDQPVASNDTPEGRQANRRVEIAIYANDRLKSIAQKKVEG